jgi:hypothetical protein
MPQPRSRQAAEGGEGGGRSGGPFRLSDDDVLEAIVDGIVAAAEVRMCPWCVRGLVDDGPFCSDVCRDKWHRHIMPLPHVEQVRVSRTAPLVTRKAMALGRSAEHAKRGAGRRRTH